ncbi:hypothetical protein BBP40_012765 [Aspergillus hancockii]|nr:hypothetical protein BBP40_012765 [Aspergillus hancockii]
MTSPNPKSYMDLQAFLQPLRIGPETLYDLSHRLSLSYKKLAASPDQFFPTPITRLPTGHETGRYLAVYVGLSYLRVAFIELLGDQKTVRRTLEKAWPIEEHLRRDHAPAFFTWIGDCIAEVVGDSLENQNETMPHEAILMPTGKGFALKSDLNLQQALLDGYECHTRSSGEDYSELPSKRRKLFSLPKLKIAVMTNDSTATLASLAIHSLPNTRVVMGLVVGAGCNATVPMKLADLHDCKTRYIRTRNLGAVEALVSTEWTLSDATSPIFELGIQTKWDKDLDLQSRKPGFQPLEYMIGGRYFGELVRLVTYDRFHRELGIPKSSLPLQLVTEYTLSTDFLSLVVACNQSDERLAEDLSEKLKAPTTSDWYWTPDSARDLRTIASFVQDRAASLVAAAIVGLLVCTGEITLQRPNTDLDKIQKLSPTQVASDHKVHADPSTSGWKNGPEELAVAVSGGVIQHYPHYKEKVQRYIDQLLVRAGPQKGGRSVFLRVASDGGLIGTGVLAGTAAGEIGEIIGSSFDNGLNDPTIAKEGVYVNMRPVVSSLST